VTCGIAGRVEGGDDGCDAQPAAAHARIISNDSCKRFIVISSTDVTRDLRQHHDAFKG
jgi:hypothetical protein